jgi:CubicO group peptidase (beta-lactamase class C family)
MPTLLPDLPDLLDGAAARRGVPGAAVAVGHGDDLAEAATGVLNLDTGVRATPDSVFQVGSVTKAWTAVLVLQLVHEGLVDLDRPVRTYLPEFAVADEGASARVTVRQLLAHTAGFAGDLFIDTGRGHGALGRYVDRLRETAVQIHPPGEMFSYCNSGYCVLGALVARLRGGTWESALRERVVTPLGATRVALYPEEAIRFRAAAGHVKPPGAQAYAVVTSDPLPRSAGPAGTVLYAAPRDLVRLGRVLCAGGAAADGTTVLSPEAVAAMRAPQVRVPGVPGRGVRDWGLGLALLDWAGTPVFGHEGDVPGQSSIWWVIPDHRLVVALCVNANAARGIFDDVLVPVVERLTGVPVPPRHVPPRPAPSRPAGDGGHHDRFAGRYVTPLYEYEVAASDGGLAITTTPKGVAAAIGREAQTDRYVPLAGDTYVTADPEDGFHDTVTFLQDGRYLHTMRAAPRVS